MKPKVYHDVRDPVFTFELREVWYMLNWHKKIYHRTDGPAIISGDGTMQWYVDDVRYADNRYGDFSLSIRNWARAALEYENGDEFGELESPVTEEMVEEHIRKVLANLAAESI